MNVLVDLTRRVDRIRDLRPYEVDEAFCCFAFRLAFFDAFLAAFAASDNGWGVLDREASVLSGDGLASLLEPFGPGLGVSP